MIAKKARGRAGSGNWQEITTLPVPVKIERHLKRFKRGISGSPDGGFSGFGGGEGNA
jgi:hypothetical protein